jgi:uncharacterized membrane protein
MKIEIKELLKSEDEQLRKLQSIVEETINEEKLIVDNLLHPPKETLTRGQTISDKVASFGGSWKFINTFSILLLGWILYNTFAPKQNEFDPYPFILMNLVLSTIAALQAPIIMMSQNRKEERDRKRNENDYMVNLKAEIELRSLHQKMDLLVAEQMKIIIDSQAEQMKLLRSIDCKLNPSDS